jgi:hypothetical protein
MKNQIYLDGLKSELEIVEWLRDRGHEVVFSTVKENVEDDIDCWVDGKSCSIKTQHKSLETGNLCFEWTVKCLDGNWRDSWYYKSKAQLYLFRVGNAVYSMDSLPPENIMLPRTLSRSVKKEQRDMAHFHTDATMGIVSMKKLIESKLIHYYGEIDADRPTVETKVSGDEGVPLPDSRVVPKPTLKAQPTTKAPDVDCTD